MRKKWTAKEALTPELLAFRERRKWQIALRRYVLEQKPTVAYAPFFGVDIKTFREWIEMQFETGIGWGDFSSAWQLDHVVPLTYFDFTNMDDMRLAWNFINIGVGDIGAKYNGRKLDTIGAKMYFSSLYDKTGYKICAEMIEKIRNIEFLQLEGRDKQVNFIQKKKPLLDEFNRFSSYQYEQINSGISMEEILSEKAITDKWG